MKLSCSVGSAAPPPDLPSSLPGRLGCPFCTTCFTHSASQVSKLLCSAPLPNDVSISPPSRRGCTLSPASQQPSLLCTSSKLMYQPPCRAGGAAHSAPQLLILRLVSQHKSLPSTWSGGCDCSGSLRKADIPHTRSFLCFSGLDMPGQLVKGHETEETGMQRRTVGRGAMHCLIRLAMRSWSFMVMGCARPGTMPPSGGLIRLSLLPTLASAAGAAVKHPL